jgi:hypothetical protein
MAHSEPHWLLASLQQRGFCVRAEGERLHVWPASKLTASDREDIRIFKDEMLESLQENANARE